MSIRIRRIVLLISLLLLLPCGFATAQVDSSEQNIAGQASGAVTAKTPEAPDKNSVETAPTGKDPAMDLPLSLSEPVKQPEHKLPSEAEYWLRRTNQHLAQNAEISQDAVNRFFSKLNAAFDANIDKFTREVWLETYITEVDEEAEARSYREAKSRQEIFETLDTLYKQKLRLLNEISPELANEITGTGIQGIEEFYRELKFLQVTLTHRLSDFPQVANRALSEAAEAPLPMIGKLLQLLALYVIYHYWMRWAPGGLLKLRNQLMKARPRTKRNLRLVKLIWYFDQVKTPLTWLLIVNILFNTPMDPAFEYFSEITEITLSWILLSWTAVLLINAIIGRNSSSLNSEKSALVLRSLQCLGIWLVISGLSLEIIERYTGKGTLFSWTLFASELLLLAVAFLLLLWWRPNIREGCANEVQQNFITRGVSTNKAGLTGYLYSALGGLYLLRMYSSKKLLLWASNFNTGQQVVDSLIGLDIARAYQQQQMDPDAQAIPAQLQEKILTQETTLFREVGNSLVKKILNSAEEGLGGLIILAGETGCGKSVVLQRVARETQRNSLLVSCPKEGLDGLVKEMARKLHLDTDNPTPKLVFEEVRRKEIGVMLIDDIHRIIRPCVGGQKQLDQLKNIALVNPDMLIVLALNTATWQYILCARDERIFERTALLMQPWSTEQIGMLIKNSCDKAGIEPDFSRVIIPRQYDNSNFDDPHERAFSGFIRMLHSASTGNPKFAMGLWVKSLYLDKEGRLFVRLPELPSADQLDQSNLTLLLLLRVICQTETISIQEINNCLQLDPAVTETALRTARYNHWVEKLDDDYYQLNWYWRRVITRVLARKNLMPRMQ